MCVGYYPCARNNMAKYDLPPQQHQYQIRIGIDQPISEMSRSFFVHGEARIGLPRVSIGEFCADLLVPSQFLVGDKVPLIYLRRGMIHFGSARWGAINRDGEDVAVQKVDGRSVGYPALIPATYIDLAIESGSSDKAPQAMRLRSGAGPHLFIGCAFRNDAYGDAQTVTPLVCHAGPDIRRHIEWQPVLIPIAGPPTREHFDFLARRNHSRLLSPSASRAIKAEIISLAGAVAEVA